MKKSKLGTVMVGLPLALGLAFTAVACGGSDTDGNKGSGGSSSMSSAGTSSSKGGTSSTSTGTGGTGGTSPTSAAGSTSKAGSTGTGTGGSTGSSGGDFMSGLPASKPLSSLTDDETKQLCMKIDNYFQSASKDFSCAFGGVFAAALSGADTDAKAQAACKAAYDMCEAAPPDTSTDTCDKPGATCTATVGELEACANDSSAVFSQLSDSFPSCDKLTLMDLMNLDSNAAEPMEPASCTALDMKCPDAPVPSEMMP